VGGVFSAFGTWYTLKHEWNKKLETEKLNRLKEADEELFTPFLEKA